MVWVAAAASLKEHGDTAVAGEGHVRVGRIAAEDEKEGDGNLRRDDDSYLEVFTATAKLAMELVQQVRL